MLKSKFVPILAGAVALGTAALFAPPAAAFQIAVCGNPCTLGGDPNSIDPAAFNIQVQGSQSTGNPLLVLIGEPNPNTTPPVLSINNAPGVTAAPAGAYFGLPIATTGSTTGALEVGNFTSGVAYDAMGLAGAGNSQSFVNWTAPTFPNGHPNPFDLVTSFDLYAIAIQRTGGFADTVGTFDLSGIEAGAFVFAYGCTTVPTPNTNQCTTTGGNVGDTPFTNVAVVVPAPAIGHGLLAVLAIGGVLFGSKLLESLKKRHMHAA